MKGPDGKALETSEDNIKIGDIKGCTGSRQGGHVADFVKTRMNFMIRQSKGSLYHSDRLTAS